MSRVMIWELPIRLFHWLLVGAFASAWLTRGDAYLHYHVFAGYVITGLLLFRIVWGFAGGHYSRFRSFAYGWNDVRRYLKQLLSGTPPRFIGHNPPGGWAIFLLLTMTALVAISGMITLGGGERHGPLAGLFTFAQADLARAIHDILAWTLLTFVVVHVAGVIVESMRHRENLVLAMISGWKNASTFAPSVPVHRALGLTLVSAIALAGVGYFKDLLFTNGKPFLPFAGAVLADNVSWRQECGSCHLAYHPSLLPARSWEKMMADQTNHFGDDLALASEDAATITRFLMDYAAETAPTKASWSILRSIPENGLPLRVTATRYWKQKHRFPENIWRTPGLGGRHDCAACHRDAELGTFQAGAMGFPKHTSGSTASRRSQ